MYMSLGKLEKCLIKNEWSREEDFSDWLFEKKNIDLLTEALDLDEIQTNQREESIGRYSADITGEVIATGKNVVIENQFGNSDHDHLGKVITYGAGKDANIIIWIVEKALEEHASAIAWLNSNSIPGRGFFMVEIELWRIGKSEMAPKFNIVERPNEWAKAEKSLRTNEESLGGKLRLSFWQQFVEYAASNKELLKEFPGTNTKTAKAEHYFSLSKKNCKGFELGANVYTFNGRITGVGITIILNDHHEQYSKLLLRKAVIERESGLTFVWPEMDTKKMSQWITTTKEFTTDSNFIECFGWLSHNLITVKRVLNENYVGGTF